MNELLICTLTCVNLKYYAELKVRHKRAHTVRFHLFEIPKLAKQCVVMEIRAVVARAKGGGTVQGLSGVTE